MSQKALTDQFKRLQVAELKINHKVYPIFEGVNTIGRHKEATVNVKHLNVSQNHAVIVVISENHYISDLNSSNGTFLENNKVDAYKLSILKNKSSIKLGDLYGTYISQGPFSKIQHSRFEMTQESFYGSNTQILDNFNPNDTDNEVEDIHDAPTQEISWDTFKIPKNVKTVGKNINQTAIEKTDNTQLLKSLKSQEEDIHNCPTQVMIYPFISKHDQKTETSKDGIKKRDEDIHNAETQILSLQNKNFDDITNPVLQETELLSNFNDEELPLPENNDNYIEVHQIPEVDKILDIHEAVTQVVDISKKGMASTINPEIDDDEATDCEDNTDEGVIVIANSEGCKKKQSLNPLQREVTDCKESTQDKQVKSSAEQENKNSFLASDDDDSNESMEFFKLDRSINIDSKEATNKTVIAGNDTSIKNTKENEDNKGNETSLDQSNLSNQSENSLNENIRFQKKKVCRLSSDSETDDEIGFRRKKKSSMVISTQDISEKENDRKSLTADSDLDNCKKTSNRDSYHIDDTDSETEQESTRKLLLEESIPATQDQTTADFNDTDCIPATQEVMEHLPIKSVVKRFKNQQNNSEDKTNGSSEESFKLGLTELMINSSQTASKNDSSQDPCCSKSLKNYFPTLDESSLNNKADKIQSHDTDKTEIYDSSTQKYNKSDIKGDSENKNITDNESPTDIFSALTQKVTLPEKVDSDGEKLLLNFDDTEDFYEMCTQKVFGERKNQIDINNHLDLTNIDIYSAPTQKVFNEVPENIYEAPTQKVYLKNIKHGQGKVENQLDMANDDIYSAPTQKVSSKTADTDQNSSKEESMDELYLPSTQQLDDNNFDQPTQKVTRSNLKIKGNGDDKNRFTKSNPVSISESVSSQSKKKFSFKKKASNLDGSLTSILEQNLPHTNLQTLPLQREDRSSTELEFVQNVKTPAVAEMSTIPANSLPHILEHASKLDNAVNPEKNKQRPVTNEIPVETKIVFLGSSGQKDTIEKIKAAKNKAENERYKNKIKLDSEKGCSSNNSVIKEERISVASGISSENQLDVNSGAPTRLLRIIINTASDISSENQKFVNSDEPKRLLKIDKESTCGISETLTNKINQELNESKHQSDNNKNESDVKLKRRSVTRRLSSSSAIIYTDQDVKNKSLVNPDLTNKSLNATTSEVNQSVAFLESKITKTRKTRDSVKIEVKVPKSRKSMTISEMNKVSEVTENDNNNRPKFDQINNVDNDKLSRVSTTRSSTVKKRDDSKTRQPSERVRQDSKMGNMDGKNAAILNSRSVRPKRNNPKLEDISNTSTSKVLAYAAIKTRQVGKRKQLVEVKSDNSDTSIQSADSNLTTPKKQKLQPIRQVGKRKQLSEAQSETSDTSIQSVDGNLVTPKKQKLQPGEALLNTKERGLRKQRPKVVFTMLESPQMESMIKQLGGSVIDSVNACTVLLTEHVKRSQKLLSAVGLGKPICSPKWITDSKKAHEFVDPWDYILMDPEAEKKWEFSLKESLNRSRAQKLFHSYNFQIMVTNASDVLKGAIESCGGKCISRIPSQPLENTFIIATGEQQNKYKRIIKQHSNIKVLEPEAIFDGVLRQELRFSKHYLT